MADDGAEDKESTTVSSSSEAPSGTSVTTTTTHISKVRSVAVDIAGGMVLAHRKQICEGDLKVSAFLKCSSPAGHYN